MNNDNKLNKEKENIMDINNNILKTIEKKNINNNIPTKNIEKEPSIKDVNNKIKTNSDVTNNNNQKNNKNKKTCSCRS